MWALVGWCAAIALGTVLMVAGGIATFAQRALGTGTPWQPVAVAVFGAALLAFAFWQAPFMIVAR